MPRGITRRSNYTAGSTPPLRSTQAPVAGAPEHLRFSAASKMFGIRDSSNKEQHGEPRGRRAQDNTDASGSFNLKKSHSLREEKTNQAPSEELTFFYTPARNWQLQSSRDFP